MYYNIPMFKEGLYVYVHRLEILMIISIILIYLVSVTIYKDIALEIVSKSAMFGIFIGFCLRCFICYSNYKEEKRFIKITDDNIDEIVNKLIEKLLNRKVIYSKSTIAIVDQVSRYNNLIEIKLIGFLIGSIVLNTKGDSILIKENIIKFKKGENEFSLTIK